MEFCFVAVGPKLLLFCLEKILHFAAVECGREHKYHALGSLDDLQSELLDKLHGRHPRQVAAS